MASLSKHSKTPALFNISFIFSLMLLSAFGTAFAQAQREALWRVESLNNSEQTPLYDGKSTPFIVRKPPPPPTPEEVAQERQAQAQAQLSPEELLAQERAQKAASLMSRIRDTLKEDKAFLPDLSGIVIEAIVEGQAGKMAYIKRKWFFAGDHIRTPIMTAQALLSLLVNLEELDKNLAEIVRKEVETRLSSIGPQKVLIKEINKKGITIRLPQGRTRVISFKPRGW